MIINLKHAKELDFFEVIFKECMITVLPEVRT